MLLDNFFLMAPETLSMFWYLVIVFTFKVYKIHMIYIQKKWIIINDVKSKRKHWIGLSTVQVIQVFLHSNSHLSTKVQKLCKDICSKTLKSMYSQDVMQPAKLGQRQLLKKNYHLRDS